MAQPRGLLPEGGLGARSRQAARLRRLIAVAAALGALAVPAGTPAAAPAYTTREEAVILPENDAYITNGLNGSGGFSMYINGLGNWWTTTSKKSNIYLTVFVWPGSTRSVTQTVTLELVSPGGRVVWSASRSMHLYPGGSWLNVNLATGMPSPGTYDVFALANGTVIGYTPLLVTPPAR